ncbi:MAG: DUF58 domain-containing protein [Caldilineaceae bacterium]|nr:DUF58 domain-containing protein [Caldilineaceae bacterium]
MSRRAYLAIGALTLLSVVLRQELLLLISVLLWLVAGAATLWARYALVALTYRRHLAAPRLYWGEETDLRIEVVNAKPLPLPWLRIDDAIPASLAMTSQQLEEETSGEMRRLVTVLSLRWYERVIRRYRVRGIQRGMWNFGPAQLRSGDIFGFDIRRVVDETPTTLLVYPRLVPVTALGLPARYPLGDLQTPRRVVDDPLRLMGVREYVQGDNFRYVHWKATARSQQLQTKLFDPSASQPLAFFLNISTGETFNAGYDLALRELAITVAASLARHFWLEKKPVGLYSNTLIPGTLHPIRVRPRYHSEQLEQLLVALAQISDVRGRWPLETLLQLEAAGLPYGATVVVITAVMNQRLEQTLLDLRRREYAVVLLTVGAAARWTRPMPTLRYHHLMPQLDTVLGNNVDGQEEWERLETINLV